MLRLVLIFIFALSSTINAAEKITLANGEWAPYLSKDLKHYGYMSHIVSDAFAEEGIEVEYVFLPWKRGFEDAKEGKYQGSLIWGYNDDRAKDFIYSDTVAELGTSLFYNKNKPIEWNEPIDLKKYKMGGVIGYAYGIEDLEKQGILKIDRLGKDVGNYKKLAAGRLDIVLEDTEVGHESVNKLGMTDQIIAHPKTLKPRKYSVIISKKTPNAQALVDAFNRGLKKLMDDGRYQKYLEASRRGEYK
jgi:polar amino acid transport system substrate-binding protein